MFRCTLHSWTGCSATCGGQRSEAVHRRPSAVAIPLWVAALGRSAAGCAQIMACLLCHCGHVAPCAGGEGESLPAKHPEGVLWGVFPWEAFLMLLSLCTGTPVGRWKASLQLFPHPHPPQTPKAKSVATIPPQNPLLHVRFSKSPHIFSDFRPAFRPRGLSWQQAGQTFNPGSWRGACQ